MVNVAVLVAATAAAAVLLDVAVTVVYLHLPITCIVATDSGDRPVFFLPSMWFRAAWSVWTNKVGVVGSYRGSTHRRCSCHDYYLFLRLAITDCCCCCCLIYLACVLHRSCDITCVPLWTTVETSPTAVSPVRTGKRVMILIVAEKWKKESLFARHLALNFAYDNDNNVADDDDDYADDLGGRKNEPLYDY